MKQNRTNSTASLKLIPHVVDDWQRALMEVARIKGLERDLSPHDKIKVILKQELKNIRQLWEAFTVERSEMPRYLLDPKKQSVAYLAGFHLPNLLRFQGLLERVGSRMNWPKLLSQVNHLHVTDWGCGTGALSHGWSLFLKKHKVADERLTWSLIDQHGAFLDTTKLLLRMQRPKLEIQSGKGRLEALIGKMLHAATEQKPDLHVILMGYVWNELQDNPRARRKVEESLMKLADQPCLIFLLEPGNQFPARQAMELRDLLVETQWQALYPCPKAANCPMLENNRDWCYSEFTWNRPPLVTMLDERLEINHEKISSSCYCFASPSAMTLINKAGYQSPEEVVVGRPTPRRKPLEAKKKAFGPKFEYLICAGERLIKKAPPKGGELLLRGQNFVANPVKPAKEIQKKGGFKKKPPRKKT
ncbi:MAG: small ribosomal subunit Rsm22 family protein [Oligoflexus sp.]